MSRVKIVLASLLAFLLQGNISFANEPRLSPIPDDLGDQLLAEKRYPEAEVFFLDKLANLKSLPGTQDLGIAHYSFKLGNVYERQQRYEEAETLYNDSYQRYGKMFGWGNTPLACAQLCLGITKVHLGHISDGTYLMDQGMAILDQAPNDNEVDRRKTEIARGWYRDAKEFARGIITVANTEAGKIFIRTQPEIQWNQEYSDGVKAEQAKDLSQASSHYEKSLKLACTQVAPMLIAASALKLSSVYKSPKKFPEAEEIIKSSLQVSESFMPAVSSAIIGVLYLQSSYALGHDQYNLAESSLNKALETEKTTPSKIPQINWLLLGNIGTIYFLEGKFNEANTALKTAVEQAEKNHKMYDPRNIEFQKRYRDVRKKLGLL